MNISPEFMVGCIILIIGTIFSAFPGRRDFLSRLINLEIPAFGLLLIMLSYDETLALLTFIAVSTLSIFIMVLVIERTGEEPV